MGAVAIAHAALISILFLGPFPSLREMPDLVHVALLPHEEQAQRKAVDIPTEDHPAKEAQAKHVVKQGDAPASVLMDEHAMLRETRYYETRELTQKPLVKVDVPTALMLKLDGMEPQIVVAHLWIGEYGDVDRVDIERSAVLSEEGKEKLQQVFSMARFHPGEIDGVPVRTHMRIAVRLDRPDQPMQSEKRGTE
ncbi:hypothetical protein GCM10011430_19750 [Oxalicibacterium solurbis]|uniref:TonB C-terminal domain-containing protein n=2 Tax=Oxalicibacterium solurbis TaxID=69280 RepID=A0A8J3B0C8_9BURK|nr:hypothetical protein GCM10011430_19750 [Oxalicibacterium solurbis]